MRIRQLVCTIFITLAATATAYGDTYTAQTITAASESDFETVIELTNAKVITDDFSFKVPDDWTGSCILVPDGEILEIYDKTYYEEDGSGLLFTITAYSDSSYQDLTGGSILGFCGNMTFVLEENYTDTFEDDTSSEYLACKKASKTLKKSFVSFIKDDNAMFPEN